MGQKFYASPAHRFDFNNGAIGFRPGGAFDTLGPYAKVWHCPIAGTADKKTGQELRLTCYATGYADTTFSIPACTKHRGKHIGGYFMLFDDLIEFVPNAKYKSLLPMADKE